MARFRVLFPRTVALGFALGMLWASAGAQAQMVGGGVSGLSAVEAAQQAQNSGATVVAQPTPSTANPATGVRPAINGPGDPYSMYSNQGTATGQYAAPLGTTSIMPATGLQTTAPQPGAQPYVIPSYGGTGEPAAAPAYSVEAPPTTGPYAQSYPPQYAPAPQQQYAPAPQYAQQPQYAQPAPQYARQPQYAPQQQYAPAPQYSAPAPQYAQPAPQPQYAQPAAATSAAMSPGNNLIPSPYAGMRANANPGQPQTPGQVEGGYTMGPGDRIRLTVFGETDLSGEYQLDGNGNVRLPLAGIVRAGGYTAQALEAVIYNALVPGYLRDPRLTVEILSYRPIYIVGQVQKPGQYAYVNDMTMLNAIGLAGGFTQQARESTVYVRHEGVAKEEEVSTAQPLLIRPGDTIRVDTTVFWDAMNMFSPLSGPAYLASSAVH